MRMMFVPFMALFWVGSAFAADKYRVGVENIAYLPYYKGDTADYGGYARDILDAFAKDAGVEFEYVPLPINRLYSDFLDPQSNLDFKYPDNELWAKDKKKGLVVHYSQPVTDFIDGVMVAPANRGKGKAALQSLGMVRGFTAWDYLDDIKSKKVKPVDNDSITGLLQQVMAGRVDGAYVNVAVADYILQTEIKKEKAVLFDEGLPHTRSHYALSTMRHPKIMERFNDFLNRRKTEIAALKKKWKV